MRVAPLRANFGRHVQRRRLFPNNKCTHFLHTVPLVAARRFKSQSQISNHCDRAVRIPQVATVAPSQFLRSVRPAAVKPPSGSETKLWSVPGLLSRRVHNSQHRWPCDAVRAARTLKTGRVAATVVRYVDDLTLRRARRRRIVRREQEAQIHHTNRLTM